MAYNPQVDTLQATEYPMLQGKTYLDHGGTTIYAKSLVDRFAADMVSNLYGNPHSASSPAMLSGQIVDDTRKKTLLFFGADPEHFDLIYTQNATASIKIVMDSFKDIGNANKREDRNIGGFWYGYHVDCHNSIVGIRETTEDDHHCFQDDAEVDQWLAGTSIGDQRTRLGLFAYPAQSNFNGRRLPLKWTGQLRNSNNPAHQDIYSLLDAAAYATTAPLNKIFANNATAPDFTVVSFYKIFGFPDLGGLIVRRDSGDILQWGRRYFGGGTVSMVTVGPKPFHHFKTKLHSSLEDGTLPFHNIMALSIAIDTHIDIYGHDPMTTISKHTAYMGKYTYDAMSSLTHSNGLPVCHIYTDSSSTYGDPLTQGSTVTFNVVQFNGTYAPYTSVVETLADERKIFVRSGQLCNPGGVAKNLGWETWRLKRLWADGYRCGDVNMELVKGRPTGVVRVSLGAMTTISNIDALIRFLKDEFMVAQVQPKTRSASRQGMHKLTPSDNTYKPNPPAKNAPAPASCPAPVYSVGVPMSRSTTLQRAGSTSSMSDNEQVLPHFNTHKHKYQHQKREQQQPQHQKREQHQPRNRESVLTPLPHPHVFQELRVMPNGYMETMGRVSINELGRESIDVNVQEVGGDPRNGATMGKKVMKKFFSKNQLRKARSFLGEKREF